MGNQWKFGDDPRLKYWNYKRKHKKLSVGRPNEIDPEETLKYSRDIERALKALAQRALHQILDAHSPAEIAETIKSLPHDHTEKIENCTHCVLLGGWDNRNQVWPRLVPPTGEKPARTIRTKIDNRTMPELLFDAICELGATTKQLRRIADSVAAPALYDKVCTPELIEPGNRALTQFDRKISLPYSRQICTEERARRKLKNR